MKPIDITYCMDNLTEEDYIKYCSKEAKEMKQAMSEMQQAAALLILGLNAQRKESKKMDKWRVEKCILPGKKSYRYRLYCLIDKNKPNTVDNREYLTSWIKGSKALNEVCASLNQMEDQMKEERERYELHRYMKLPIVIEAFKTDREQTIQTLEGALQATRGDYIITGIRGEKYPCKPDVFERTYERVPDDTPLTHLESTNE